MQQARSCCHLDSTRQLQLVVLSLRAPGGSLRRLFSRVACARGPGVDGGVNPAKTENLARDLPRLTSPSWPSFDQMQTAVR
jgi:hypothetical protein